MRKFIKTAILAGMIVAGCNAPMAFAGQSHASASNQMQQAAGKGFHLAPFPAAASTEQTTVVAGHTLHYKATVGWLPVYDSKGKMTGQVVYTAFTMPGKHRPVTFAFNGGPGASSVYLDFGAIGPKKVNFGDLGDAPSQRPTLHDNPATWLGFTDLVFIDPIGTGYSRALVDSQQATKDFYSTDSDIHYLSRIVYDWLAHNHRMDSPKYLVGESYGGFRGPRIALYLQTQLGVALNGFVLFSPYLDPADYGNRFSSPVPWMLTLPPIAAAHLEREGKLTTAAMQPIIHYTLTTYATTLMQGRSDPAAYAAMIQKVTQLTGLDPTYVKQSGGRISTGSYLREVHRSEGKIGSVYDSNYATWDPFPYAPRQMSGDPLLNTIIAPTTEAMVHFINQTVGWKYYGRYNALSYKVNALWHEDKDAQSGSVKQLRKVVANDSNLRVLIAHGWNDLSCPFMMSVLAVNQMPAMGNRVEVKEYPGGHMFYTRKDSGLALQKDVHQLIEATAH
ncbi:MAG TPA: peptidase S10 [Rhodanobacteraceae bacterium]